MSHPWNEFQNSIWVWHYFCLLTLFKKLIIRASINKSFQFKLKFPYILNILFCLLAVKYRSQNMWLSITIFSLSFPCLFISCSSGEYRYSNLNLTSLFDPVVWAINHKACVEDWLLVKGSSLETKTEANQTKPKCLETVLKSKILCLFVIPLKERFCSSEPKLKAATRVSSNWHQKSKSNKSMHFLPQTSFFLVLICDCWKKWLVFKVLSGYTKSFNKKSMYQWTNFSNKNKVIITCNWNVNGWLIFIISYLNEWQYFFFNKMRDIYHSMSFLFYKHRMSGFHNSHFNIFDVLSPKPLKYFWDFCHYLPFLASLLFFSRFYS